MKMKWRPRRSKNRAGFAASSHCASTPVRRERASHRRSELLGDFFEHIADAIFVVRLNGRIIDLNPAACGMLGYSRHELLAMYPWDFVTSASRAEILGLMRDLQRRVPAGVQRTCCTRGGEHLEIDLRLTRFERPGRDLVVVSCRDVTQTRRLEGQLRESEGNLAEAQRLTKTGSWVLDPVTGKTNWSVETCRIFGFPDPPPSPNYSEFIARVHPHDREPIEQIFQAKFAVGRCSPFAVSVRAAGWDGKAHRNHLAAAAR
jgi:PAS domain S-box-containing protein